MIDKSEILFKRLLLFSLLAYFIPALFVELIPYSPEIKNVKPLRSVRLMETPLKSQLPVPIPAKIKEKEKSKEELKKRLEEDKKRLAEEQKKTEEAQRLAEGRRRQEEERRKEEEEKRRAEEEKRLAKERNREVAMNSGLLKAMKGDKKSLENIISNEETRNVLSDTRLKSTKTQQDKTRIERPVQQKKVLKGSEGIGNVGANITKTQPGGLSGQRGITGIDIRQDSGGGIAPVSKTGINIIRSQESIKEVVNSHRGGIDFIYKKALRNNPTLKGVIIVEFTIPADGNVVGARIVSSTIKEPTFEEQVLKRIQSWKFPPLPDSGNTVVTYPIEFYPV